jgi:hypothetical protein
VFLGAVKRLGLHTAEDSPVSCEETVLESLFYVALGEGILFRYNLVQVLASVDGYLVTAMAVVDTKEGQSLVGLSGLSAVESGLEIEDAGVCVLHADSPALHGRSAVDECLAIAVFRFLRGAYASDSSTGVKGAQVAGRQGQ